jgi:hypothetical protein
VRFNALEGGNKRSFDYKTNASNEQDFIIRELESWGDGMSDWILGTTKLLHLGVLPTVLLSNTLFVQHTSMFW